MPFTANELFKYSKELTESLLKNPADLAVQIKLLELYREGIKALHSCEYHADGALMELEFISGRDFTREIALTAHALLSHSVPALVILHIIEERLQQFDPEKIPYSQEQTIDIDYSSREFERQKKEVALFMDSISIPPVVPYTALNIIFEYADSNSTIDLLLKEFIKNKLGIEHQDYTKKDKYSVEPVEGVRKLFATNSTMLLWAQSVVDKNPTGVKTELSTQSGLILEAKRLV